MDLKEIYVTSLVRNETIRNRQPKSIRHNRFTHVDWSLWFGTLINRCNRVKSVHYNTVHLVSLEGVQFGRRCLKPFLIGREVVNSRNGLNQGTGVSAE